MLVETRPYPWPGNVLREITKERSPRMDSSACMVAMLSCAEVRIQLFSLSFLSCSSMQQGLPHKRESGSHVSTCHEAVEAVRVVLEETPIMHEIHWTGRDQRSSNGIYRDMAGMRTPCEYQAADDHPCC